MAELKREHEDSEAGVLKLNKGGEARDISINAADLEIEGTTIKSVVIATENPIMTNFGEERLVITNESVDLEKFKESGIPILQGHDKRSRALGRAKNPVIADGTLRADMEFDPDYFDAMEQFRAIKKGTVTDVSVGLIPTKYTSERLGESLAESHTIDEFYVFEVSCLGVGSDASSGFYRVNQAELENPEIKSDRIKGLGNTESSNEEIVVTKEVVKTEQEVKTTSEAPKNERKRAPAIEFINFAKNHYEPGEALEKVAQWEQKNFSMAQAKDEVLSTRVREHKAEVASPAAPRFTDTVNQEKWADGNTRASYRGFIDALVSYGLDKQQISNEAGLAREISQELGGGTGRKLKMPYDMLPSGGRERVFQSGGAATGSPMITDQIRTDKLADYLYNNTVTGQLGVESMTGMVDNQSIPRVTKVIPAQFVAEGANANTPDVGTDNVPLTPKTAVCATKLSNLSRFQVPGAQAMLERILLRQLNVAVDRVTLLGGGAGEPSGIVNKSYIKRLGDNVTQNVNTALTGAANAATRRLSVDAIRAMIAQIRGENVQGQLAVVAPPEIINYWRGETVGNARNVYKWELNANAPATDGNPARLWDATVYSTTNLRQPTDGDDNHRVLVGMFRDMSVVQAFWGNSFTLSIGEPANDFTSDQQTLRMVAYMDVAVPYPQAFLARSAIIATPV